MVLSKLAVDATCAQITHSWTPSCLDAYQTVARYSSIGGLKMLMPLLFINYGLRIWKKKKSNGTLANDLSIDLIRGISMGVCLATSSLFYSCAIRYLIGRHTISTIAFMPAVLSGLTSINILSSKMRTQVLIPISNSALESIVLLMSSSGWLTLNQYTETIFFMFTNACLMYASKLSSSSYSGYTWFFKPNKKCSYDNFKQFLESTFKKTRNYFGLGLGFGIIRTLLANTSILKSKNIHKLFNARTLRPGIFAGSYVALYETIIYAMNRYFQRNRSICTLLAGFLAGLSYTIDPSLAINISAFTNLIQILYYLAGIQLLRPPVMETVIFGLCYGILMHIKLFYPNEITKFGSRMIEEGSGNKFHLVSSGIKKYIIYDA